MNKKTFSGLPVRSSLRSTDCIVGFTNTSTGGERKWTSTTVNSFVLQQIAKQPYAASAWVSFKGTGVLVGGSATIYGSYNVDSVVRLPNFTSNANTIGNGCLYQVNFVPGTMKTTKYGAIGSGQVGYLSPHGDDQIVGMAGNHQLTSCRIGAMDIQARGSNLETSDFISVIFIGGQ